MSNTEARKPQQAQGYLSQRRMVLSDASPFVLREAYRTLRTNILFALRGSGCKKFCITSSAAGEGKSIMILNLAISFSQSGKKVLLIDADLRRPALARLLTEKATPGLSNILADLATEDESIRRDVYPNLDVILSGNVPPNPSELLSSERMQPLIDQMSEQYDYILVDTPPVTVVSDACIVASLLDGVLLLVRQGRSRKDAVKQAVNQLAMTDAKLLGYVLNGVEFNETKYYGYESV